MSEQTTPSSDFLDHDPADTSVQDWAMADENLKKLLEQVDLDIKGWRPEQGDKIAGKVVDITEGSGDYGEYPLLVIQTPSGNLTAVHCFHEVLRKEIERKINNDRLHIDDLIAISYRGQVGEAKPGQSAAHMYRVAIQSAA